jgi:hypothetical protein
LVPRTPGSAFSKQFGHGVRDHVLRVLVNADIAHFAADGKGGDAVHALFERCDP